MSEESTDNQGFDYQEDVGFGEVQTATFPKYQGRKGVTDRVAVLSAKLKRSYSYYVEDGRTRFRVDKSPPEWITKRLGQPEQKFALVFFKYATDEDGELHQTDKLKGKIVIWVFSETKFDQIKAKFMRYPLMNDSDEQKDLIISCTDAEWQKLDFDVADDAFWRSKPEWIEALNKLVDDALKRADYYLGFRKTEDEIKQILGVVQGSGPAGAADDDVDLGDVLAD